jgi:transcriptional regulator with XRE-family HTH domain
MIETPTPDQIVKLRRRMGWSQFDVARKLHFGSVSMISRYERGTARMQPAFWELLCIKAVDEKFKVTERKAEILRHMNSRVFVKNLIGE